MAAKLPVDSHFFASIDSELKAYWLGFMMADGNVSNNGNGHPTYVRLNSTDREVLDGFAEALGSMHRILERKQGGQSTVIIKGKPKIIKASQPSWSISISDVDLCRDLARFGVVPRKTYGDYLAGGYERVPDAMFPHFLRGFFDGDGYIVNGERVVMGLCNNDRGFLEYLASDIDRVIGVSGHCWHSGTCHKLIYNGRVPTLALRESFYGSSTVFLSRKRDTFYSITDFGENPVGVNRDCVPLSSEIRNAVFAIREQVTRREASLLMGVGQTTLYRIEKEDRQWIASDAAGRILAYAHGAEFGQGPGGRF